MIANNALPLTKSNNVLLLLLLKNVNLEFKERLLPLNVDVMMDIMMIIQILTVYNVLPLTK